jgi:hypothetical protein
MSVEVKEIQYENYGRCVQISNGLVDVAVTIEVGPRIVRFGFVNGENVFYNDLERKLVKKDQSLTDRYGKDAAFYYYGGHRVWLSPERMPETYYPDNEPVVYAVLPEGVSFTPNRQKRSDMQTGFEIMLAEDATDIMVVHSAKNNSKEKQTCALWAVTMLNGGGTEIIPQNREGVGSELLPNRILTYWPYTDLHDERISVSNRFITVRHDADKESLLKLGINNDLGWAAYFGQGYALVKRFVYNAKAAYPDFGCSYETAVCGDYVEMQTLSPLYHMEPGEGIRHVENLALFRTNEPLPADENDLDEYIANLT